MGEREGKGGEKKEEGGNQWLRYINTRVTILYGQSGTCTEVVTVISKMLVSCSTHHANLTSKTLNVPQW